MSRNLPSAVPRQNALAAGRTLKGFDVGQASISRIETGLRGVSDLEMVMLAKALCVDIGELVPAKLPKWVKDTRPPTAKGG